MIGQKVLLLQKAIADSNYVKNACWGLLLRGERMYGFFGV
jgi:hypothetical protein